MSEVLETTAGKLRFRVPTDRLYGSEGIWVLCEEHEGTRRIRLGLSDFLQQHSGDAAFVTVKPPGTKVEAGDELAELETIKVTLSLGAPVGGTVVEVNAALESSPEVVNQDPYGEGWLAVIEPASWDADRAKLLEPTAYFALMQTEIARELEKP